MKRIAFVGLLVLSLWGLSSAMGDEDRRQHHEPIKIEGEEGFRSCFCVRGGSGTAEDPYIISDWRIDLTPYRHQFEETGPLIETDAEPHTVVGIEFRNTSAHVVVENLLVEDDGPQHPDGRDEEHTVGFKFINASNIRITDVEVDETWASYSYDPGPVDNLTFENTKLRSTYLAESDTTYLLGEVGNRVREDAPNEFEAYYDAYVQGYVPTRSGTENLTFRNVTAEMGVNLADDDSRDTSFRYEWGATADNLTVDNLTVTQAGPEGIAGTFAFDGNAVFKNIDAESNLGFYCKGGLCEDVEMRNITIDGHASFRSPDGNMFFTPDDMQNTSTPVRNLQVGGDATVQAAYGLHDAFLGELYYWPADDGRRYPHLPPVDAYPLENVTVEGYSKARVDIPLRTDNVSFQQGIELFDAQDRDPLAVFTNTTAGELPLVSLLDGGPHSVQDPVAGATVASGAVVDELTVRGQNEQVYRWTPFGESTVHSLISTEENTTLRNVTIDVATEVALPLKGSTLENVTIVGQDHTEGSSHSDAYLFRGIDIRRGENRIDNLTIDGAADRTRGMAVRNPAEETSGSNWRIEDVILGIKRACYPRTDICRHVNVSDLRIDSAGYGIRDSIPFFPIGFPHIQSEGPWELEQADISAPVPGWIIFGAELTEVNIDRTDPAHHHFQLSQHADVHVDGAWFDTGVPVLDCGSCRGPASDQLTLVNLQHEPYNQPPTIQLEAPPETSEPGAVALSATVEDDWDAIEPPTWTLYGERVGEGTSLDLILDHDVHPIAVSVTDQHGKTAEDHRHVPVKAPDRPLAFVHPVGEPSKGDTVEVTGEGLGDNTTLSWDLDADGTIDGEGSSIHVTIDERRYPVRLVVEDEHNRTDEHTREIEARDDPPTAAIDAPEQATAGETVTVSAVGQDDWGIAEHHWRILPEGAEAEGPSFTFTPDRPGPLPVRLSTTDTGGQTSVTSEVVDIADANVPLELGVNPIAPTTADTVQLTAENGEAWRWDVGDDGSIESTAPYLRWRFSTPGTYDVRASGVLDGERQERLVQLHVVNVNPSAAIAVQPGPAGAIQLSAIVSDEGTGSSYWDVDQDGQAEFTGATASWVPPSPGVHAVMLTVVDDDGGRTNVTRSLDVPTSDVGLSIDAATTTATAPFQAVMRADLPVPLRADTWRVDVDGDGGFDDAGELPMPSSFTAFVNETGQANVSLELLSNDTVVADAQRTLEGLEAGQTPPLLNVTAEGLGPGYVEGEPLTVTVKVEDPDGLAGGRACLTVCLNMSLDGTADTDRVVFSTPAEGTPITVEVTDEHGATNHTEIVLDAKPAEAPELFVAETTNAALEPFMVPVEAEDPDGRSLDVTWTMQDRSGVDEPGPFHLPSGSYEVEVTAENPSGVATTTQQTALVDEVHEVHLSSANEDPAVGESLTFLAAVDDSHGRAHDVEGTLELAWYPIASGPEVPLGSWKVDEPRERIETDVRQRPGTVVANLTVEAGPSPMDPLPSRDEVSVEISIDDGGVGASASARSTSTEGGPVWPDRPANGARTTEAQPLALENTQHPSPVEGLLPLPTREP